MKKIKYLFLLTLLILSATGIKAQVTWPNINTPPAVCEGTKWDTATLRALCLNGVDSLPNDSISCWRYCRGGGSTWKNITTGYYYPRNGDRLMVRYSNVIPSDNYPYVTVTVWSNSRTTIFVTSCDSYRWNNTIYTYSTTDSIKIDTVVEHGCDSIITLNLTIDSSTHTTISMDSCDHCTWHNTVYTRGGSYTDTLTRMVNTCDSIVTLNLNIRRSDHVTTARTVCDTLTWNGTLYNTTGTFQHEDTNVTGCDSVTTLNLTVNNSTHDTVIATACDTYTWNWGTDSVMYALSGTYTRNYLNSDGCFSTDTLHLTINKSNAGDTTAVACDSYGWYEHTNMTTSQNVTHLFHSANQYGCDSTVTLHLTVNYSNTGDTTAVACDSYGWYEHINLTSSQNVTHLFHSANRYGCDSTVTLHLTVNYSNTGDTTAVACDGFTWHGTTYTASTDTLTFTSTNHVGCDSVTTLHLTINHSNTGTETVTSCDNYLWHGTIYRASTTTPTYTSTNISGCDSVTTLHLTINYSDTVNDAATACEEYTWYGRHYLYSNNYRFDTVNDDGCHRLMTLDLVIHNGDHNAYTQEVCESYTWHDTIYSVTGIYTYPYMNEYDCKSVDTLHLIVYGAQIPAARELVLKNLGHSTPQMIIFPRAQGENEYAYQWYRDDVPIDGANKQYYRFQAVDKGKHTFSVHASPTDQKLCFSSSDTTLSVKVQTKASLAVSPNPNNGVFSLSLDQAEEEMVEVGIFNAHGSRVATIPIVGNTVSIQETLPQGVYMLRVVTDKGNVYTDKIVVK